MRFFTKKMSDQERLKRLQTELKADSQSIMQFWLTNMHDPVHGGVFGMMTSKYELRKQENKALVQHLRVLWAYALTARVYRDETFLKAAHSIYHYVQDKFFDPQHAGYFWELDYKGGVADSRKMVYGQQLAIYALSEYHLLTSDQAALDLAVGLFDIVESKCLDATGMAYVNGFEQDWSASNEHRMVGGEENAPIHVGVLVHALEAYSTLFEQSKLDRVRKRLLEIHLLFHEKLINPDNGHLYMYFDENWKSTSDEIRLGHEVEYAWLAIYAAQALDDPSLEQTTLDRSMNIFDNVRSHTDKNSAIYYTKDVRGKTIRIWRWWDQAEMMLALWYAYKKTSKTQYLNELWDCWNFVKKNLRDPKMGDWKWNVRSSKRGWSGYYAGPWKTPYHAVRATCFISDQIANSLKS